MKARKGKCEGVAAAVAENNVKVKEIKSDANCLLKEVQNQQQEKKIKKFENYLDVSQIFEKQNQKIVLFDEEMIKVKIQSIEKRLESLEKK